MEESQWDAMEQRILATVEENRAPMLATIKRIASIRSDHQPSAPNAPFGKGIQEALTKTLAEAQALGFRTRNLDNYFGYASYGSGEAYIGVMGHLDTVPAGNGWTSDPFTCVERAGRLYARGILDNKGPILTCLYALYALKQLGWQPQHEIRILFGTAEEIGFQDIPYYLQREKPPLMGFTPDCKYPVVYAERGRLVVRLHCPDEEQLLRVLNDYFLNTQGLGEALGLRYRNEEFGELETRNYRVITEAAGYAIQFAISYPSPLTATELVAKLKATFPALAISVVSDWAPVYFDQHAETIQTLSAIYGKMTGRDATPVTTTGGTYAKVMPHIFPFGPSFPGQKGISHHPDEWMAIDDLLLNAKIYALALYHLGKRKDEAHEADT